MPQKSNPVLPSLLVAIARQVVGLNTAIQSALPQRQERDAAAWITEWMSLPQMLILAGRALCVAEDLAKSITPDTGAMLRHIEATGGTLFAEALSFTLSSRMPRPDAQAEVKRLTEIATSSGSPLAAIAAETHPELDLAHVFDHVLQLGQAPVEARDFAARSGV